MRRASAGVIVAAVARKPSKLGLAWTAARLASRQALGSGTARRDLELGEALMTQLDEMKGLAMKLGQIVSYMGVPLSDPVQATLARLQTGERSMSEADTRAVIEAGLGRPVEDLFEAFDWVPVAAASIGQVHRARVEGQAVAVKVQYRNVAGSFDQDLAAVGRIAGLAGLASAVDGQALVRELAKRLEEECDYLREAAAQQAFARAFIDDDEVVVPAILGSRSCATVLCSGWVEGRGFEQLREDSDDARRARAAATLVRFSYRSLYRFAAVQADPHPGNYVFMTDAVAFLDFGCVRRFERAFIQQLRELARCLRDRDRRGFRAVCNELGVVGNARRFDYEHFFMVMEHLHRPLLVPSFRFTADYMREGYEYNGPTSPNARALAIPPAYLWVMRLQWGLWATLAKLEILGSFGELFDELLAAPITPLVFDAAG